MIGRCSVAGLGCCPGASARRRTVTDQSDATAARLDRAQFDLVFADDFTGDGLDAGRWIYHCVPHWTTAERSAARYALDGDGLRLLVDADQPAWRPEDGRSGSRTCRPARSSVHAVRASDSTATARTCECAARNPPAGCGRRRRGWSKRGCGPARTRTACWRSGSWACRRSHRRSPGRFASPSCTAMRSVRSARRWVSG
jgi:hypothetical protein